MFRRRRSEQDEPFDRDALDDLEPRWRSAVDEALASRGRLRGLVEDCRAGPLQDRLASSAQRADTAVVAAVEIATRAQAASRLLASMDLERVRAQLKGARRRLGQAQPSSADHDRLEVEVRLLVDQHAALNQLRNAVEDAAGQLRMLDLRLDAAVARSAQLALRPDAVDEWNVVDRELDAVVTELTALGAGFEALSSLGG